MCGKLQHNLEQFALQRIDFLAHASTLGGAICGGRDAAFLPQLRHQAAALALRARENRRPAAARIFLRATDPRPACRRAAAAPWRSWPPVAPAPASPHADLLASRGPRWPLERHAPGRRPRRPPVPRTPSAPRLQQKIGRIHFVRQRQHAQIDVAGHEQFQHFVGASRARLRRRRAPAPRESDRRNAAAAECGSRPSAVPSTATVFSKPN